MQVRLAWAHARARTPSLGPIVFVAAIKTAHRPDESLSREAVVANYLHYQHRDRQHPNVVSILGIVCEDEIITRTNVRALALQPYANGNMADFVLRNAVSNPLRWCMGLEVIGALVHAHNNGLAHCDLRPHNILISSDETAVVCDWAFATKLGPTSRMLGALPYRAPEVQPTFMPDLPRGGAPSFGVGPVDVWTFGVVALFLCAPHELEGHERTKSWSDKMKSQLLAGMVPDTLVHAICNLNSTDEHRWASVIWAALKPDPCHRPSMAELELTMMQAAFQALVEYYNRDSSLDSRSPMDRETEEQEWHRLSLLLSNHRSSELQMTVRFLTYLSTVWHSIQTLACGHMSPLFQACSASAFSLYMPRRSCAFSRTLP